MDCLSLQGNIDSINRLLQSYGKASLTPTIFRAHDQYKKVRVGVGEYSIRQLAKEFNITASYLTRIINEGVHLSHSLHAEMMVRFQLTSLELMKAFPKMALRQSGRKQT